MARKSLGHFGCVDRTEPSRRDRDRDGETEGMCVCHAGWHSCVLPRKCNCQDYELISPPPSQRSPSLPLPRLSCLQQGASRLPGTRSDELTRANGYTDFQHASASLSPAVASPIPSTSLNISIPGSLLDSLRVMWQSADLGPYLCLQLRSHSFLHQHLICHHCQSEQIRVSAAESERPPSSPCP